MPVVEHADVPTLLRETARLEILAKEKFTSLLYIFSCTSLKVCMPCMLAYCGIYQGVGVSATWSGCERRDS